MNPHTEPTWYIDSDSAEIAEFVESALGASDTDRDDPRAVAVALFYAVRDSIRYDPYAVSHTPEDYRASTVVRSGANWCVPKAIVYTAALRHVRIPARLGFADVRNHLTSEKLSAAMGTDVFAWHGYTEVHLDGGWRKASTAFNIELCERFGVKVLDFDGTTDALMHPFDKAGNRHMEYIRQRGSYDDLPLEEIFATFAEIYPTTLTGQEAGAEAGAEVDADFAP